MPPSCQLPDAVPYVWVHPGEERRGNLFWRFELPRSFSTGKTLHGLQMRNALALMAAALAATVVAVGAQARDQWPDIPAEVDVRAPIDGVVWIPYRCNDGPVYNFYHRAYYGGQPPAVFLGYAYRPFYRYTAYRVMPRTYFCSAR